MNAVLMILSALLTAVATAAIAFFSKTNLTLTRNTLELTKATHELTKAMKESSDRYQEDMKKLQIALAAAQLYAATNPSGKPLSSERLEEYKGIVANGIF